MKAQVFFSGSNQGTTFRLIKQAVDIAAEGKSVLFVNTEMSEYAIMRRIFGYYTENYDITTKINIDIRDCRCVEDLRYEKPYDVVVIDSPIMLLKSRPITFESYEDMFNMFGDSLIITNIRTGRNVYDNGRVTVNGNVFPKWITNAIFVEKVEDLYISTDIDLNTCTKTNISSVLTFKKSRFMEISYLGNYESSQRL